MNLSIQHKYFHCFSILDKVILFFFIARSCFYYPTTFKSEAGIVFNHGVQMCVREKACLGCMSETMRCNMLILDRDIG